MQSVCDATDMALGVRCFNSVMFYRPTYISILVKETKQIVQVAVQLNSNYHCPITGFYLLSAIKTTGQNKREDIIKG